MITGYVVHDDAGRIIGAGVTERKFERYYPRGPGLTVLWLDEPITDIPQFAKANYVANGEVAARRIVDITLDKSVIAADGADVATIGGLPIPSTATIVTPGAEAPATIEDGSLEITSDHAGTITVHVDAGAAFFARDIEIAAV